jgi:hypothetical protein
MRIRGVTLGGFGLRSLIIIIVLGMRVQLTSVMMGNSCCLEMKGGGYIVMIGRLRRLIEYWRVTLELVLDWNGIPVNPLPY